MTGARKNKKGRDVLEGRGRRFRNKAGLTTSLVLLVKQQEGALISASAEVLGNLDKSRFGAVKRRRELMRSRGSWYRRVLQRLLLKEAGEKWVSRGCG